MFLFIRDLPSVKYHSDEANMPKTARKRPSKKVALRLTQQDRELALGFLIMDQYLEDRLKRTPSDQKEVFFTLEELRDFFGWFNAPGNQSKDEEVQRRLDLICERIEHQLQEDMYED